MKEISYEIKKKWLNNVKHPNILDGALRVKIPEALPRALDNALESDDWRSYFGGKPNKRKDLIRDVTYLMFDLYNDTIQNQKRISIVVEVDLKNSGCVEENGRKNGEEHSGDDTKPKRRKSIVQRLLDEGYIKVSKNLLCNYYDKGSTIGEIIDLLGVDYVVDSEAHKIADVVKRNGYHYVKFNQEIIDSERIDVLINRDGFVKGYKEYIDSPWKEMNKSHLLSIEYYNFTKLILPTEGEISLHLHQLIGQKHKGKVIITENEMNLPIPPKLVVIKNNASTKSGKYVWIEDWQKQAKKYAKDYANPVTYSWVTSKLDENIGRHYSPYSLMPSRVRELLTLDGEPLVWVDVNSCHQILLMTKFMKDNMATDYDKNLISGLLIGHSRENLAKLFGIECSVKFKNDLLAWANCGPWSMVVTVRKNGKSYKGKYSWITDLMRANGLSNFVEWLIMWKRNAGYKAISRWLLKVESMIMDAALLELWERDVYAIGCHDGIDTLYEHTDTVREVIEKHFFLNGYPCSLKDDRKKKQHKIAV